MDNLFIIIGGLLLIVIIVWIFRGSKKGGGQAQMNSSGFQVATIKVKGGYSPARIIVQSGSPVRFQFMREETAACSEMVVFPDFQKSTTLPVGQNVAVELPPMQVGTYDFTCQMGMYKGQIIVRN